MTEVYVDTLPALLIAGFSPDEADAFGDPRGVQRLTDGSVLALDGDTRQLGVWDSTGVLRWKAGREGSGPGEFRTPQIVGTSGTDSIFIYDPSLRRLSLWLVGHGLSKEWRTPADLMGNLQPVGVAGGAVIARLIQFTMPSATATLTSSTVAIIRWRAGDAHVDTLAEVENGVSNVDGYRFYAWQSVAIATDSSVVYGRGDSTVLHEIDLRGREIATVRWTSESRLVTEAQREAIREFGLSSGPLSRRISDGEMADTLPRIGRIVRDRAGGVWIPAYEGVVGFADSATRIGANGRHIGSFALPRNFRISFVDSTSVLGVLETADGARVVASFPVLRRTAPTSGASVLPKL